MLVTVKRDNEEGFLELGRKKNLRQDECKRRRNSKGPENEWKEAQTVGWLCAYSDSCKDPAYERTFSFDQEEYKIYPVLSLIVQIWPW